MTDLIKFLRTSTSSAYNKVVANRIKELEDRNKKLTLQLLATSGHDRREAKDRIEAVEREWEWWRNECQKFREAWVQEKSKLTKAVEALRETTQMLSQCTFTIIRMKGQYFERHELVDKANAVLAELEK